MTAGIGRDVRRHAFSERELRVLWELVDRCEAAEAEGGSGIEVVMERWELCRCLGLRTDKVLEVCRDLQRARVLKPGWEEGRFVLEPNADVWKREELAPAVCLAQRPLGMESGDPAVQFEHAFARAGAAAGGIKNEELRMKNLAKSGAGELPARSEKEGERAVGAFAEMNDGRPGELPGDGVVQFPESGKAFPSSGRPKIPQSGEVTRGGPADAGLRALPDLGSNVTLERLSVSTFERINVERLQERIRRFVGETDFDWYWRKASYIWNDPVRCKHTEETVAMALAGFASGELKVKTTPGKALWSHVNKRWEAFQMQRARA